MISAHRCGAGTATHLENTRPALDRALQMPIEFVEFDVQRCGDGTFVLYHDDSIVRGRQEVPIGELTFEEFAAGADHFLRYDDALHALAGGKRAHIDLKFTSPPDAYQQPEKTYEVEAAALAVAVLGVENLVITTLEDRSVRAVRDWAEDQCPQLLVGLSLGRDLAGNPLLTRLRTRLSELLPARRYRACRANLVVVHERLARVTVASFARRRGLPMLVWTVDDPERLSYWLSPGCAWLVTTHHPERAVRIRALRQAGP